MIKCIKCCKKFMKVICSSDTSNSSHKIVLQCNKCGNIAILRDGEI